MIVGLFHSATPPGTAHDCFNPTSAHDCFNPTSAHAIWDAQTPGAWLSLDGQGLRGPCDAIPYPLVYLEYEGISSSREILSKISTHVYRIRNPTLEGKLKNEADSTELVDQLSPEYNLQWCLSVDCAECHNKGGQCTTTRKNEFICEKVIHGCIVILCMLGLFIWCHKRRINDAYLLSRNIYFDPSSKSNIEAGSFYFGIPIFSYTELEVATNNFDSSRELGDGGFGTVYYGKLQDGREVAVKCLYEHNYKRVEQFMNEIKILTCLRHQNLVSFYCCTSGAAENSYLFTKTATTLAYMHASDIIHRDVKTNNILLDNNFCVNVVDFGLSRLFPNDELRPSMEEVLEFLKELRGDEEFEIEKKMETNDNYSVPRSVKIPPLPETDDVVLLKSMYLQSSPNDVTDMWISNSSTTSSSVCDLYFPLHFYRR
ncbi:unnamed protein product [Fraxinus pennsylvanica]|uniref:Protein kinase domain-containing protein n=1 Tax=Fraxinus pennsylvanica TaxID=56036 RepID=A0AAD2E935_9LAMI|nr:unnamed protein product [Fraxinus pennsylvanica]